jgi:LAO/AO transport system kinase
LSVAAAVDEPKELAKRVLAGDRRALAKAITLLEGARPDQRVGANELLALLTPRSGHALRLGISGPPGVGKSTFIEALGKRLVAAGHKLAVLAIDPSSPISGGSIMGDRTRMEELSRHPAVFIRPSPAGGTLGGVARRTREAMIACEAAGFDLVVVETVGVGQSEVVAASMVDAFLILHLPNAGDELQGIKRGILELADLVAVTKADGALQQAAKTAQGQLARALMLVRGQAAWQVPVLAVSSLEGLGLDELWREAERFIAHQRQHGVFETRRREQALSWFHAELGEQLREQMLAKGARGDVLAKAEARVAAGSVAASVAASEVLGQLLR